MRRTPLPTGEFRSEFLRFGGAMIATFVSTVLSFSVPLVIQVVLDTVLTNGEPPPFRLVRRFLERTDAISVLRQSLFPAAFAIVFLVAVGGVLSFLAGRWSAAGAERGAGRLRDRLYAHLHAVSLRYHGASSSGDTLQRCTSDVDTVRKFFAVQALEIGRAIAMVVVAIPVMVGLQPRLTVIAMGVLPPAIVFTVFFFLKVQSTFTASDEAEGDLSSLVQEHIQGVRVVRAFAAEPRETERFRQKNRTYRDVTMKLLMLLARYWALSSFLVIVQTGAVLIPGILMVRAGNFTVGGLLVFLMLEQMLLWPVQEMGRILADLGKARVSLARIGEILQVPVEDQDPYLNGAGTARPTISGAIRFERVSFSYAPDMPDVPPVLKDISFSISAGTTVGILGATGTGKSTMMMLLARLYDPTGGRITVDGVDITTIDRKWMRTHIGYVLQEPFLFAGTVRDNISFARSSAAEAEIIGAARAAAVHDSIESFREGYDTLVGEKGVTLSGGQKQRLTIARALLMGTPILVFDDSLSAVDTRTDARIREALLAHHATVFLISHRSTTLVRTDHLLVLEAGSVVESGSPQELLRSGGRFARIWELQQGDAYDRAE